MSFEILPDVYLELPNSSWPPASDATPAGIAEVVTWDYDREIVGNMLPGNVRGKSGLSIGDGAATIRQTSGKPLSPWGRGDRKVVAGGKANLYATHGGPSSPDRLSLGSWMVDPLQGSLLSPEVPIQLIESQYAARTANTLPMTAVPVRKGVEAAWVVDTLARQAGFYSTPKPVASCILSIPLQGHMAPERGTASTITTSPEAWSRTTGPLGPASPMDVFVRAQPSTGISAGGRIFLTANVAGTARFTLGFRGDTKTPQVEIRPAGVLAVRNGTSASFVTGTYIPGASADHPMRVQVEVERTGSASSSWTQIRARARSGPDAAWGAWVTSAVSISGGEPWASMLGVTTGSGSSVSGIQVSTEDDPGLWAASTAGIDPLLGLMDAPWLPAATDAWAGIQEVCAAYCGAAWVANDGRLTVRNREYMSGAAPIAGVIEVDSQVEDLGWSLDPNDDADRLVITYSPVDREVANTDVDPPYAMRYPIAWQASDVLEIGPGQTVEVVADVAQFTSGILGWIPAWSASPETLSTWAALPNRDGTGTQPGDTALALTTRSASAGRFIIKITNTTAQTLYTVDATGQPCLIMRGDVVGRQESQATITRGATEVDAKNELSIDLGKHVQRADVANSLADFIWSRVSQPSWKANAIRVKLDWSRDMGAIVQLVHPDSDLSVKALVVGIHMSGSDGSTEQLLDLVILPPTWFDFDEAWTGKTWPAFDTTWTGKNWSAFDAEPLKTS